MADSYYGGGGGNEWELVSLTASTYAAAPGPVPVPVLPQLHDAHNKTQQLTPPPPAAAIFMSQHFNLPAATGTCADLNPNGGRQQQLTTPAMLDDEAVGPESETEQDDGQLTVTSLKNVSMANTTDDVLIADADDIALLPSDSEERQGQITPLSPAFDTAQPYAAASSDHHHIRSINVPAAHDAAATDGITTVVCSAYQPAARAVPSSSGVAELNKVPSEDHAWWNKTVRFLRNNSKESLTFRFIFVAATGLAVLGQRDQLKLEFDVDTEKISCAVREPLGQVKLNMLVGGRPVAQG